MTTPSISPRAAKVDKGAAYVGVSRATLYREQKAGRIQFMKIDGCTLVEYSELDRWFNERATPFAA